MSEMVRKNCRITKEQNAWLKMTAEKKGTTESNIMMLALEEYMQTEIERAEKVKKAIKEFLSQAD